MFYIIKTPKGHVIHEVKDATDGTYADLKIEGLDVQGQFGRKEYAQIWADYYDNKFDQETLRMKLEV